MPVLLCEEMRTALARRRLSFPGSSENSREMRRNHSTISFVESGKLMFEVQSEGPLIKFTLALSEGHLKGEARAEDGGRKLTAQVDAERVKAGS
jgi:hypothetical protein